MKTPNTIDDMRERWSNYSLDCQCHWHHFNSLQELGILWINYLNDDSNIRIWSADEIIMHIFNITKDDVRAYNELQNL